MQESGSELLELRRFTGAPSEEPRPNRAESRLGSTRFFGAPADPRPPSRCSREAKNPAPEPELHRLFRQCHRSELSDRYQSYGVLWNVVCGSDVVVDVCLSGVHEESVSLIWSNQNHRGAVGYAFRIIGVPSATGGPVCT